MDNQSSNKRRHFLKQSTILTAGIVTTPFLGQATPETPYVPENDSLYLIGPMKGYSPQIGTMLSMMNMMRHWIVDNVKNLTQKQLDFQIDEKSNAIGAMLLHLAATERWYQITTFDEYKPGKWPKAVKTDWDKKWAVAQHLGQKGREQIKGHSIDFYLQALKEVREVTKKEFAKRDDRWIQKSERFFDGKPTNNYSKWFHVCEHESNHRGQIKFILKRLP